MFIYRCNGSNEPLSFNVSRCSSTLGVVPGVSQPVVSNCTYQRPITTDPSSITSDALSINRNVHTRKGARDALHYAPTLQTSTGRQGALRGQRRVYAPLAAGAYYAWGLTTSPEAA